MTAFDEAWRLVKEEDPHAHIPDENKGGDCYRCAANHIYSNPETHTLVHGMVTGSEGSPVEGERYGHAWTEFEGDPLPNSDIRLPMVYDPTAEATLPAALYYWLGGIKEDELQRYSHEDMVNRIRDTSIWGPWDD